MNLARASTEGEIVRAVFFDYSQKALTREREAAGKLAAHYGCEFIEIGLPWFSGISRSALLSHDVDVPEVSPEVLPDEAGPVWVPNRNCVFISIGAAFAEGLGADSVVAGLNLEEGASFPDNSPEFREAMEKTLSYSTLPGVGLVSFTQNMTKPEIVREASRLDVPLDMLWYCYLGGNEPCGKCESCVRFNRAIKEA